MADLAVFEAATSEAFALRVHRVGTGGEAYWSAGYYTPYSSSRDPSASANDTTPTLFDLGLMGLADGEVVNARELTNLLPAPPVRRVRTHQRWMAEHRPQTGPCLWDGIWHSNLSPPTECKPVDKPGKSSFDLAASTPYTTA